DPEQVELMDGAATCIAGCRDLGYAVITASNQSGVARGFYGEDDVRAVNRRMDTLLRSANWRATIDRHMFCPHHPTEGEHPDYVVECECRKPEPGMLTQAAAVLGLDLSRSWMVGDAPRDIEAGHRAGCKTILLRVEGIDQSPAADAQQEVEPDHTAASLAEVLSIIQAGTSITAVAEDATSAAAAPMPIARKPARPSAVAAKVAMDEAAQPMNRSDDTPSSSPASAMSDVDTKVAPVTSHATTHAAADAKADAKAEATQELLSDLRRERELAEDDFSVIRLLAGVTQVLALGVFVWGIVAAADGSTGTVLQAAIFVQLLALTLFNASK
ncbi:MAG: HAD family hydrolase, partial [Planctomycetota bacterium]